MTRRQSRAQKFPPTNRADPEGVAQPVANALCVNRPHKRVLPRRQGPGCIFEIRWVAHRDWRPVPTVPGFRVTRKELTWLGSTRAHVTLMTGLSGGGGPMFSCRGSNVNVMPVASTM